MSKQYDAHLQLYAPTGMHPDEYREVDEVRQVPSDIQVGDVVEAGSGKYKVYERSWFCSQMYQTLYIKALKI